MQELSGDAIKNIVEAIPVGPQQEIRMFGIRGAINQHRNLIGIPVTFISEQRQRGQDRMQAGSTAGAPDSDSESAPLALARNGGWTRGDANKKVSTASARVNILIAAFLSILKWP